jgi:hypothetical protein
MKTFSIFPLSKYEVKFTSSLSQEDAQRCTIRIDIDPILLTIEDVGGAMHKKGEPPWVCDLHWL